MVRRFNLYKDPSDGLSFLSDDDDGFDAAPAPAGGGGGEGSDKPAGDPPAADKKTEDADDPFLLDSMIPDAPESINTVVPDGFDFTSFAKELGMPVSAETKIADKVAFKELYSQNLENNRKTVKFDLGTYGDEAVQLAEYLSSGGSLKDFIDPLKDYNAFLALSDVEVFMQAKMAEGMKEADARELVDGIDNPAELKKEATKIRGVVENAREAEVKNIIARGNSITQKRTEQAVKHIEAEKAELIAIVGEMQSFMDVPLTDNDRKKIVEHINNGAFFNKLKDPRLFVNAYLHALIGNNVSQYYANELAEARRQGFNVADIRSKSRLRTVPDKKVVGDNPDKKSVGFANLDG